MRDRFEEEAASLTDLKFLHFGMQCPYHEHLIARLERISAEHGASLQVIDFSSRPEICREYTIFSPTLLVVNGRHRWNGPFRDSDVLRLLADDPPTRPPYSVPVPESEFRGRLVPLDCAGVRLTCQACFQQNDPDLCAAKARWVGGVLARTGLPHLGYVHMNGDSCVGGAEFLPISEVPYAIPNRRRADAFITCSFVSSPDWDFKSHPLRQTLSFLRERGFSRALVIASRDVVFPNGPMRWFEQHGFVDLGQVAFEPQDNAEMHLLEKAL